MICFHYLFFLPFENADFPFHHWWLGMPRLKFAPAFYILVVFFQMSEGYALQETRNIRPVITQATDNKLQAFPRRATEIGCLSVDDFMGREKGFPIALQALLSLLVADASRTAWCHLLLLLFGMLCFDGFLYFSERLGRQRLLGCGRMLWAFRLLCLYSLSLRRECSRDISWKYLRTFTV